MGINFPASPTLNQKYPQPPVAGVPVYTWDGEKWTTVGGSIAAYAPPADAIPLMDATPGLVGTTTEYAREDHVHPTDTTRASVTALNTAVANATSLMAYSGMQINGGMEVSQEMGGAARTTDGYIVDGWRIDHAGAVGFATGQDVDAPPGLGNSIKISPTTPVASLGATDYLFVSQIIEGFRASRLAFGSASAQPITVCFWSKTKRTGQFSGCLTNRPAPPTRSYPFTFTTAVADTWQFNTVTIPGDVTGAWVGNTNTASMQIYFSLACGVTYSGPPNVWAAANYVAATGSVNGISATTDYLSLTGVTVLPGTQAPTAAQSPNIMRPYDQELQLCKRYYEWVSHGLHFFSGGAGYQMHIVTPFVEKRVVPTVGTIEVDPVLAPGVNTNAVSNDAYSATNRSVVLAMQAGAAGACQVTGYRWPMDARL